MRLAAAAIGAEEITLVLGAGCSRAAPTNLPTSRELSLEVFNALVAANVITAEACVNPSDLSCVADAVWEATGSQGAVVQVMGHARFRNAATNVGYNCAAALLLEGVIGTVVTLNYDLAMSNALSPLNAGDRVAVLKAPEESNRAKPRTIVYLHRNIECADNDLIMRTEQLTAGWRERWEEVAALGAITAPVSIFVGLGTPTPVLTATVDRIRRTLTSAEVFLVGLRPLEENDFAAALGIDGDHFVQADWNTFMWKLAQLTLARHRELIADAAERIAEENATALPDAGPTFDRLSLQGLDGAGMARGRWLYQRMEYVPLTSETDVELVADLLAGVAQLEAVTGSEAANRSHGIVEFRRNNTVVGRLVLASGRGSRTVEAVATRVRQSFATELVAEAQPTMLLLGGAMPNAVAPTPPIEIVDLPEQDDITAATPSPASITLEQLRADPQSVVDTWLVA